MLHTLSDAAVIARTELSAAANPPGVATGSLRSVESAVRAQCNARGKCGQGSRGGTIL